MLLQNLQRFSNPVTNGAYLRPAEEVRGGPARTCAQAAQPEIHADAAREQLRAGRERHAALRGDPPEERRGGLLHGRGAVCGEQAGEGTKRVFHFEASDHFG